MSIIDTYFDYTKHFLSKEELNRLYKKDEDVGLKYHERNLLHKDEWARKVLRMRELGAPIAIIENAQHIMNLSLAEYNASRQALDEELEEAIELDKQVGLYPNNG